MSSFRNALNDENNLLISIAMATYNGEKYIEEQIVSIHNSAIRANARYEIVIVDDCSTDSTLQTISSLSSKFFIRLYSNKSNMGPSKSFERCIGLCNGDVIFTSDQDDIWIQEKIENVLNCVEKKIKNLSNPFLFSGDALLVDENGQFMGCSFFEARGHYTSSLLKNFVKFRHLGCTMAFNQKMKDLIYPFPACIPQHDIWIFLVAKAYQVPFATTKHPLIKYRRHYKNASSALLTKRSKASRVSYESNSTISFKLKTRISFVFLYISLILRRALSDNR